MSGQLTIRTSNSTRPLLDQLLPLFERDCGIGTELIVDSSKTMLERIENGERADVAVLQDASINKLAAAGIVDPGSSRPFANALIGLAGLQGRPKPAIHDVAHFKATLLAAQSIAHTQFGPSGRYFPELVTGLGISDKIAHKIVTRPGGYIARVLAAGEAELAFQQICELLAVPGVEVIGPIPAELQRGIVSKIAVFADSERKEAARELLAFLARPEHEAVFSKAGLEKLL